MRKFVELELVDVICHEVHGDEGDSCWRFNRYRKWRKWECFYDLIFGFLYFILFCEKKFLFSENWIVGLSSRQLLQIKYQPTNMRLYVRGKHHLHFAFTISKTSFVWFIFQLITMNPIYFLNCANGPSEFPKSQMCFLGKT